MSRYKLLVFISVSIFLFLSIGFRNVNASAEYSANDLPRPSLSVVGAVYPNPVGYSCWETTLLVAYLAKVTFDIRPMGFYEVVSDPYLCESNVVETAVLSTRDRGRCRIGFHCIRGGLQESRLGGSETGPR